MVAVEYLKFASELRVYEVEFCFVAACDTECAGGCNTAGGAKCDGPCNLGFGLTSNSTCAGKSQCRSQ
jgi:hypothetical protein